ncbi:glycosyltransferase family 4 protein [Bacteroides sp.]
MQKVLQNSNAAKQPIKIAYCLPSLYIPGGMERVLTIKANYFADTLGYDVTLILTDGKDKEPFYKLSPKVRIIQLDINFEALWNQPLRKKVLIYLQKQRIYKRKLKEALMFLRPDITVSMLRREINFITSIHDGSVKIGELHVNKDNYRDLNEEGKNTNTLKRILSAFWMWQLNRALRKLNRFVILTHEDRENWKYLNNTTVIPNPLPFFPEEKSDCDAKEVIAVGRYAYQKGFDLLIEAWRIVSEHHPDWNLRIYGGGDRSEFIRLKEKYNLTSLHLEEQTSNITEQYCKSSIFVLSSRYEGFGMVITEAMACGVPPVSFACPCGPRDIIRNGEDGFLVENGNVRQLAEKIIYLMEHEEERKTMGVRARANVERFRIERVAEQWKDLFESTIKKGI